MADNPVQLFLGGSLAMKSRNRFFVYIYCNDLAEMRAFYSGLLGLQEIFCQKGPEGGLGYHIGDVQFTIFPASEEQAVDPSWHWQPGWSGGVNRSTSWSIQLGAIQDFRSAVQRLTQAGVSTFYEQPHWQGYWSFPVKDPVGNTVELTCSPVDEPTSKAWEG